jgi:hypothetical protein
VIMTCEPFIYFWRALRWLKENERLSDGTVDFPGPKFVKFCMQHQHVTLSTVSYIGFYFLFITLVHTSYSVG